MYALASPPYRHDTRTCNCPRCTTGGPMTTQSDLADSTALSPKAAGILTRAVRALLKTDPKGAAELVQDASVDALAKADSLLLVGDDTGHPGHVEDLWD